MTSAELSEKHEEILESIWKAAELKKHSPADILAKCAVDFTEDDLQFLDQQQLIKRSKNKIVFAGAGKKIAEKIIRRHRIAEVLLATLLRLKSAEMERIACEVEHSLVPEVEEAICTLLGHPEFCPDGKPIPRGACCETGVKTVSDTVVSLAELRAGEKGKITYIKPANYASLEQLISFGVSPGTVVELMQKTPVYCIKFENTELALDKGIIENIYVWKTQD